MPSPKPLSCSGSKPTASYSDPTPQASRPGLQAPTAPLLGFTDLPPARPPALFRGAAPLRRGRLAVFLDTTEPETRSVCAGWEPMRVAGVPAVPLECPLSEPRRYRVCASELPVGGGAIALVLSFPMLARWGGFACLFACLFCVRLCLCARERVPVRGFAH